MSDDKHSVATCGEEEQQLYPLDKLLLAIRQLQKENLNSYHELKQQQQNDNHEAFLKDLQKNPSKFESWVGKWVSYANQKLIRVADTPFDALQGIEAGTTYWCGQIMSYHVQQPISTVLESSGVTFSSDIKGGAQVTTATTLSVLNPQMTKYMTEWLSMPTQSSCLQSYIYQQQAHNVKLAELVTTKENELKEWIQLWCREFVQLPIANKIFKTLEYISLWCHTFGHYIEMNSVGHMRYVDVFGNVENPAPVLNLEQLRKFKFYLQNEVYHDISSQYFNKIERG
jgi:hypothetical protein